MNKLYLFFFFSLNVIATPQIPDVLIYNGKEYEWNSYNPGRDYLINNGYNVPADAIETTANSGYYFLTYKIENDSLFLTDVSILIENLNTRSVFKEFFKNKKKVFMETFSNISLIGNGEKIENIKQGWSYVYHRHYLLFEFNNGVVKKGFDFSNRQLNRFKRKLFNKYKKTEAYKVAKEKEKENIESINADSTRKISTDQYLEMVILRLVKTLDL